jgi:hypothetical protein
MRQFRKMISALFVVLLSLSVGCQPAAQIDPQADQVLRDMSETLTGAAAFQVVGIGEMDEMLVTGQWSQFTRVNNVTIVRPNRLHVDTAGDDLSREVWYDGQTLTVLDRVFNEYVVIDAPATVEATIDFAVAEYGLTLPVADVLVDNPYDSLTRNVQTGTYLGLEDIGTHHCHHLLFTQEVVDWQIWIDANGPAVPRKIVIIYKTEPDQPRFSATFTQWDLTAAPAETTFTPELPADAQQVTPLDLLAGDVMEED